MPRTKQEAQRRKKRVNMRKEAPFPIPIASSSGDAAPGTWFYYTGYIDGSAIVIRHSGDMDFLYKMGFFGKGTLSRGQPNFQERRQKVNLRVPKAGGSGDFQSSEIIRASVMSKRNYLVHRRYKALVDGDTKEYSQIVSYEDQQQSFADPSDEEDDVDDDDEDDDDDDENVTTTHKNLGTSISQAYKVLSTRNATSLSAEEGGASTSSVVSVNASNHVMTVPKSVLPYVVAMLAEVSLLSNEQITTFIRVPGDLKQSEEKYRRMRAAEISMLKQMYAAQFPGRNFKKGEIITLDEDEPVGTKEDLENEKDDAVVISDSDEEKEDGMETNRKGNLENGSRGGRNSWDEFEEGDAEFWGSGNNGDGKTSKRESDSRDLDSSNKNPDGWDIDDPGDTEFWGDVKEDSVKGKDKDSPLPPTSNVNAKDVSKQLGAEKLDDTMGNTDVDRKTDCVEGKFEDIVSGHGKAVEVDGQREEKEQKTSESTGVSDEKMSSNNVTIALTQGNVGDQVNKKNKKDGHENMEDKIRKVNNAEKVLCSDGPNGEEKSELGLEDMKSEDRDTPAEGKECSDNSKSTEHHVSDNSGSASELQNKLSVDVMGSSPANSKETHTENNTGGSFKEKAEEKNVDIDKSRDSALAEREELSTNISAFDRKTSDSAALDTQEAVHIQSEMENHQGFDNKDAAHVNLENSSLMLKIESLTTEKQETDLEANNFDEEHELMATDSENVLKMNSENSNDSDDVICIESESAEPKKLHNFLSQSPKKSKQPVVTKAVTFMSNITQAPTYVRANVGFASWDNILHFNFTGDPSHLPTAMSVTTPAAERGKTGSSSQTSGEMLYERVYPPVRSLIPGSNSPGAVIKQRVQGLPCLASAYLRVSQALGVTSHTADSDSQRHHSKTISTQTSSVSFSSCQTMSIFKSKRSESSQKISPKSSPSSLSSSPNKRAFSQHSSSLQPTSISQSTALPQSGIADMDASTLCTYLQAYQCQHSKESSSHEPSTSNIESDIGDIQRTTAETESMDSDAKKSDLSDHSDKLKSLSLILNRLQSTWDESRNTLAAPGDAANHTQEVESLLLEFHMSLSQYLPFIEIPSSVEVCLLQFLLSKSKQNSSVLEEKILEATKNLTPLQYWLFEKRLGHLEERQQTLSESERMDQTPSDYEDSTSRLQSSIVDGENGIVEENKSFTLDDNGQQLDSKESRKRKGEGEDFVDGYGLGKKKKFNEASLLSDCAPGVAGDNESLLEEADMEDSEVTASGKENRCSVDNRNSLLVSEDVDERDSSSANQSTVPRTDSDVKMVANEELHLNDKLCEPAEVIISDSSLLNSQNQISEDDTRSEKLEKEPLSKSSDSAVIMVEEDSCADTSDDILISKVESGSGAKSQSVSLTKDHKTGKGRVSQEMAKNSIDSNTSTSLKTSELDNLRESTVNSNSDNFLESVDGKKRSERNSVGGTSSESVSDKGRKDAKHLHKTRHAESQTSQSTSKNENQQAGSTEDHGICIGSSSEEEGEHEKGHTRKQQAGAETNRFHPYSVQDEPGGDMFVVANTSDDDDEDEEAGGRMLGKRQHKWRPCLKKNPYPAEEKLHLMLEEAFFLSFGLGCLRVLDPEMRPLDLTQMWQQFQVLKDQFVPQYVAYHYFRSKGWVPKSGLKFGCDLILYREGPPFFHGSYSVIVVAVNESTLLPCIRNDNFIFDHRKQSWISLAGLNRITEHVAKELMMCYVIWPSSLTKDEAMSPDCISRFKVKEVVVSRWVSSQERENKTGEEEMP